MISQFAFYLTVRKCRGSTSSDQMQGDKSSYRMIAFFLLHNVTTHKDILRKKGDLSMRTIITFICLIVMVIPLVSCQNQEREQTPPAQVQSVGDYEEAIQTLTLQVVYENGEEVRVHYVQNDKEEWVYHNDLVAGVTEENLQEKINELTIDPQTFSEVVLQQVRYVFDFGGTYDVLDLAITFTDGKEKRYGTNDQ